MKRWMRCAAWLYPVSWRKRYAVEFDALLEDAEPRWSDLWDIVQGALTMQMKLWTFGKVAAGCAVAGLLIAAIVAFSAPSIYRSQSVMKFGTQMPTEDVAHHLNQAEQEILSRRSLAKVIMDAKLYEKERAAEPLEDIVQQMRNRAIQIRLGNQSNVFSIAFDYPDPAKAQRVTQTLTSQFIENNLLQGRADAGTGVQLEVLDPANLPQQPVGPRRSRIVIMGMVLGLVAGTLLFGAGRWPRVALTGLAAGFITLIAAYFLPDTFMSTAVLRVPKDQPMQPVVQSITEPAFLGGQIRALKLYPGEPPDTALAQMRNHDLIIHGVGPHALEIQFRYSDRYKAQKMVQAMAARAAFTPGPPRVEVIDWASLPEQPFQPNRPFLTLLGILAGVLLGAAWTFTRRRRTPAPA